MCYKKLQERLLLFIFLILSCSFMGVKAMEIPPQPLAKPLLEKAGNVKVTDDWLASLPFNLSEKLTIEWLNTTHLIYTLPTTYDKQSTQIEIIDTHTGEHSALGKGEAPKPSPNGQWIAFSKGKGKEQQLWLMKSNGTEITQLTHKPKGLGVYKFNFDLAWSPDSRYIALSHSLGELQSAIDVIDISNLQIRHILTTNNSQIRAIAWFPDAQKLLFWQEQPEQEPAIKEDLESIQTVRLSDGDVCTLTKFNGLQQFLTPTISADGKQIAIMYDPDHPRFDTNQNIGLMPANCLGDHSSFPVKQLTYDVKLFSPQWSHDGQSIYALRIYGAYKQIYNINTNTGKLKQITNSPASVGVDAYALSPDSSQLAWLALDAHGTWTIRFASNEGKNVRDLLTIPGVPEDMALSEVREIEWDTLDYPARMRGLLIMPLNYQPGIKYPLIVDIHGGGSGAPLGLRGAVLVTTPLEWQMWAAKGYAVFVPEFRSSGAFGPFAETHDDLKDHDIIDKDIIDVETGIDSLIASGIVDSKRLAVIGHSAGGRRVNWLTTTRHQFRAVVSKEGWADDYLTALNPPKNYPIKRMCYYYGGTPQEVPQNYLKNSSLFHTVDASTPTLFLMGNPKLGGADISGTVPLLNGLLKAKGIETQYIYYPDEGHVFEKPGNRLDALKRSETWIDELTC
jgi:dipeptidyl aminopeptidase/acylaminoacyl peptidase